MPWLRASSAVPCSQKTEVSEKPVPALKGSQVVMAGYASLGFSCLEETAQGKANCHCFKFPESPRAWLLPHTRPSPARVLPLGQGQLVDPSLRPGFLLPCALGSQSDDLEAATSWIQGDWSSFLEEWLSSLLAVTNPRSLQNSMGSTLGLELEPLIPRPGVDRVKRVLMLSSVTRMRGKHTWSSLSLSLLVLLIEPLSYVSFTLQSKTED